MIGSASSFGKWLGRILNSFFNAARRIGVSFGIVGSFGLGLAFALAGGYLATASGSISFWRFILPVKAIGLVSIAVGCFVSGWLAACFTASAIKLGDKDREQLRDARQKALENEKELKQEKEQRLKTERELFDVKKELKDRASKGVDVAAIESILELALAKSELYVTDFDGQWIPESFHNPSFGAPTIDRYVEVYRKPFEAKFGINLKDIRIVEHDGVLMVDGLQAKNIGSQPKQGDEYEWPLIGQLQTYRLKKVPWQDVKDWPEKDQWKIARGPEADKKNQEWVWIVDQEQKEFSGHFKLDSATVQDLQEKHRARVESAVFGTAETPDSIDNRFGFINETIVRMGKKIIERILAPLGKQITFLGKSALSSEDRANWPTLIEFCKQTNDKLTLLENKQ